MDQWVWVVILVYGDLYSVDSLVPPILVAVVWHGRYSVWGLGLMRVWVLVCCWFGFMVA